MQEYILQAHRLGAQAQHRAARLSQRQRERTAQVGARRADGGEADLAALLVGDTQFGQAGHLACSGHNGLAAALCRGGDRALGGQLGGQLLRCALRHEPAVGNDEHPVTDGLDLAQNMAGQDDRVGLAQVADEGADLDHLRRVQADGGFIQNDDLRRAEQRSGNTHTLTVALGQVADQALLHALQARAGRGVLHCGGTIRLFAGALQLGNEQQILLHGHILIQRRQLRQVADAGLGRGGLVGNVVAVDFDRAVRGRNVAGNNVHGGGLARAVGAEQAVDAAILHGEADVVHRGVAAVALCQMLYFDQSAHSPFHFVIVFYYSDKL